MLFTQVLCVRPIQFEIFVRVYQVCLIERALFMCGACRVKGLAIGSEGEKRKYDQVTRLIE